MKKFNVRVYDRVHGPTSHDHKLVCGIEAENFADAVDKALSNYNPMPGEAFYAEEVKESKDIKTRQDYMSGKCTHEEYYDQFVTPEIISAVREVIGAAKIHASTDPHFNDIALHQWDNMSGMVAQYSGAALRQAGDFPTLAGCVCIAKAAARQIKTKNL